MWYTVYSMSNLEGGPPLSEAPHLPGPAKGLYRLPGWHAIAVNEDVVADDRKLPPHFEHPELLHDQGYVQQLGRLLEVVYHLRAANEELPPPPPFYRWVDGLIDFARERWEAGDLGCEPGLQALLAIRKVSPPSG